MAGWLERAALVGSVGAAAGAAWLALRLRPRAAVDPPSEPGRHRVRVVETRRVVPGEGLPAGLSPGASNNNLDAVRHADGCVYLAFRSAPHHFASPHTRIHVVRSQDERTWEHEASFSLDRDLREPRLLSLGDRLHLYVSRLGRDPLAFEPQGLARAERAPDGRWSELAPFGPPAIMGWRVRTLGGVPVFLVYSGGESIYRLGRPALRVELWRSDDGRSWEPYDPKRPAVYEGGGSEADCVLGDDGALYGVIRNEAGDGSGWGSLVCRAEPGDLARWECRPDRRKYDSPCMFWHGGEAWLVARRNLNGDGAYDLGRGPGRLARTIWNQVNYSLTRKRTALWRYVQGEDRLAFVRDLPSRGDCCFPAVLEGASPQERVVYDYSCDLEGLDLPWLRGQRGRTSIYRHVLRFEPTEPAGAGRPERPSEAPWPASAPSASPPRSLMVQYWRSFEHLERYATDPAHAHRPAWAAFNRALASSGDVGIWHETYRVRPGDYECIYNRMPAFGLARATRAVPATGRRESAPQRIAASG